MRLVQKPLRCLGWVSAVGRKAVFRTSSLFPDPLQTHIQMVSNEASAFLLRQNVSFQKRFHASWFIFHCNDIHLISYPSLKVFLFVCVFSSIMTCFHITLLMKMNPLLIRWSHPFSPNYLNVKWLGKQINKSASYTSERHISIFKWDDDWVYFSSRSSYKQ